MRRPGPLQDLPLDHFLPPDPNLPTPRPNKRPLSPGGPNLISPAKRRILNEEGIFSPAKTSQTPISRSAWDAPVHFAQVLSGPQSPAKILDFGTHKHRSGSLVRDFTPTRPTTRSVTRLAASPEFKSVAQSLSPEPDSDQEMDDYFSGASGSSQPSTFVRQSAPIRETLSPVDPQSIHYPGFRVYYDERSASPIQSDMRCLSNEEDADGDTCKENFAPRRKLSKAALPNVGAMSQLLTLDGKSCDAGKPGKVKSTPKKIFGMEKHHRIGSPTLRRPLRGVQSGGSIRKVMDKGRKRVDGLSQEEREEFFDKA